MPPKGKRSAGKDSKGGEEKREEPLQAVVFADSFETRFNPFTLERPRCLLPLANTPLIEYTLEFLAGAGVEEVYLYCGNHTDAVEEYLNRSKWVKDTSPFSLEVIRSASRSVGDCMRDLDAKQLIIGDFIAVYADVVANVPLDAALVAHRTRREKDKKALMTMVLREAGGAHRTKSQQQRRIFVIDPQSQRCVHYEQLRPGQSAVLDIPGEVLKDHVELEVREDLIDCGIDICTPEVLAQYTDNFDWQLPRRGFLYGTLKDFETFQYTVHTHIANDGYAARILNLRAYDSISKDVLSRWTYPLTPDTNIVSGQSFQLHKGNVYREDGVQLARSSNVNRGVVLGKATTVGEHTSITNSVIGRRCVIGARVKIDGAYIWDDAKIGDDTVIESAIIANDAVVGNGCRVEAGALLSYGVRISDGTTTSGKHRLSTLKRKRGYENDEVVSVPADPKIVGSDGVGYHMELDEDEEDVLDTLLAGVHNMDLAAQDDAISDLESDLDESDDEAVAHHSRRDTGRSDSFASAASDESGETRQKAKDFHQEAVNSMVDDMAKGNTTDDIKTEFKALILGVNAEDAQIQRVTATAFSKRLTQIVDVGKSPREAVDSLLPSYKEIITAYVSSEDEQAAWLLYLQTDLVHRNQGEKILLFLSNALAHQDIIEPEGFEKWWNDPRSSASPEMVAVRKETEKLVEVLCASDDEDSEDEDSDDD
ncbi:Putative W2 domain, hexapeptide transferase, nucleotide-diphospho-sugar transferase [Septoria linicola]|uniref:Translation initiation factor eIF2B subunit epsilon n=1 Tax=Septoria linicola TaxID=215465 RepID=A0A9Q9AVP6_9PEZI|nr:putative W2 domain, hexapeptide transferase, nucleotide-diphospho-sugar transferase [Septoria linicola]USW56314.1 Putative W2 domain, hexapeptide transferase, nucleotide-diphospho-sugar transferase [Septoria linicola]